MIHTRKLSSQWNEEWNPAKSLYQIYQIFSHSHWRINVQPLFLKQKLIKIKPNKTDCTEESSFSVHCILFKGSKCFQPATHNGLWLWYNRHLYFSENFAKMYTQNQVCVFTDFLTSYQTLFFKQRTTAFPNGMNISKALKSLAAIRQHKSNLSNETQRWPSFLVNIARRFFLSISSDF